MSARRRRLRADQEHDRGLVDFLPEAETAPSTVPSRPWPPAGSEVIERGGGGDAPTLLSIANDDFLSEEPLRDGSAMMAAVVPVSVAAARTAPPPSAMPRVSTLSVYAIVAIGGAAVGWFTVDRYSRLAPEAHDAALVTSALPEWVPFATLRPPVRAGSIQMAVAVPEERIDVPAEQLATPQPRTANTPTLAPPRFAAGGGTSGASSPGDLSRASVAAPIVSAPAAIIETAPTASPDAPRAGAAAAASIPEVANSELPPSEPSRPPSAPTAAARADAPRGAAPRADASRPDLPRAEEARRRDTNLIATVLDRYVGAFNTLDANAARAVWPSVDARALDRVFTQLEEQELTFEECRGVELDDVRATVVCRGVARFVPRVGSRTSRSTQREWTFRLQKVEDRWTIDSVNIR